MLRQQLQQHLRNQMHAMRGFGDYLRRNLAAVAGLALNTPVPYSGLQAAAPGSGGERVFVCGWGCG
jgi:TBCC domain-containing protein 1